MLLFVIIGMHLEGVLLSEISQRKTNTARHPSPIRESKETKLEEREQNGGYSQQYGILYCKIAKTRF